MCLTASVALALAGCGGGGGTDFASIPPPPVAPTPSPTPTPSPPPAPPPIPAGPIGLQSDAPFATQGAFSNLAGALVSGANNVQFSYSASTDTYTITLPEFKTGQLITLGGNGSYVDSSAWQHLTSTYNAVSDGPLTPPATTTQPVGVNLQWPADSQLTYTGTGSWQEEDFVGGGTAGRYGVFAYGIPTAASDMPLTGAATYNGSVSGMTNTGTFVDGSVFLSFDFGAGTLSGSMAPELVPWDAIALGTYTFENTVYSPGSTSFSGTFNVPGVSGPSSFNGNFNGPQAVEFMGSWNAPYAVPGGAESGTMAGIWTGKKN